MFGNAVSLCLEVPLDVWRCSCKLIILRFKALLWQLFWTRLASSLEPKKNFQPWQEPQLEHQVFLNYGDGKWKLQPLLKRLPSLPLFTSRSFHWMLLAYRATSIIQPKTLWLLSFAYGYVVPYMVNAHCWGLLFLWGIQDLKSLRKLTNATIWFACFTWISSIKENK